MAWYNLSYAEKVVSLKGVSNFFDRVRCSGDKDLICARNVAKCDII